MKKSIYDQALRKWLPKRYIKRRVTRAQIEYRERRAILKSSDDRQELRAHFDFETRYLYSWLESIQDDELLKKAAKMDVSLDDIPRSECAAPTEVPGHWYNDDDLGPGIAVLPIRGRRSGRIE